MKHGIAGTARRRNPSGSKAIEYPSEIRSLLLINMVALVAILISGLASAGMLSG